MCPNADKMLDDLLDQNEMEGPVFKIKDDPRMTKVGKFIRATRLDEIPQILNILKGDMSIVGPRPALPREVELYDELQKQRMKEQKTSVLKQLAAMTTEAPRRNMNHADKKLSGKEASL